MHVLYLNIVTEALIAETVNDSAHTERLYRRNRKRMVVLHYTYNALIMFITP